MHTVLPCSGLLQALIDWLCRSHILISYTTLRRILSFFALNVSRLYTSLLFNSNMILNSSMLALWVPLFQIPFPLRYKPFWIICLWLPGIHFLCGAFHLPHFIGYKPSSFTLSSFTFAFGGIPASLLLQRCFRPATTVPCTCSSISEQCGEGFSHGYCENSPSIGSWPRLQVGHIWGTLLCFWIIFPFFPPTVC